MNFEKIIFFYKIPDKNFVFVFAVSFINCNGHYYFLEIHKHLNVVNNSPNTQFDQILFKFDRNSFV